MPYVMKVEYKDTITPTINRLVDLGKDLRPLTNQLGDRILSDMQLAHRQGLDPETMTAWAPSETNRGGPLHGNTGRLLGHFFRDTIGGHGETISVYNDIEYAGPQQRGDKVVPKKAKFLALPNRETLSQAEQSMSPRAFPNTWVMPSKSSPGVFVIMQRLDKGKKSSYRMIFTLHKFVQLKKRNMLGVTPATWPVLEEMVKDYAGANA